MPTGGPSYILGSSYALHHLTERERQHLDQAEWVFVCNSWLSNWEHIGIRPTVWAWGDNHDEQLVEQMEAELAAIRYDRRLRDRLRHRFVALEMFADCAKRAVERWQVDATYYRRGNPWDVGQSPGTSLDDVIYHYGSTLTDLVNLAWILNPGQEIRIVGNAYHGRWGHFYEPPDVEQPKDGDAAFWRTVVNAMWLGLAELRDAGLPLVDCNREHGKELPAEWRLVRGELVG